MPTMPICVCSMNSLHLFSQSTHCVCSANQPTAVCSANQLTVSVQPVNSLCLFSQSTHCVCSANQLTVSVQPVNSLHLFSQSTHCVCSANQLTVSVQPVNSLHLFSQSTHCVCSASQLNSLCLFMCARSLFSNRKPSPHVVHWNGMRAQCSVSLCCRRSVLSANASPHCMQMYVRSVCVLQQAYAD